MNEMIDAIRAAVAESATAEQKVSGAQACRTLLAALGAQIGKPIPFLGAPVASPLAALSPEQTLDLVIAKLRSVAESREAAAAPLPAVERSAPALRVPIVATPPRNARPAPRRPSTARKP
jgi:hypothetical protein